MFYRKPYTYKKEHGVHKIQETRLTPSFLRLTQDQGEPFKAKTLGYPTHTKAVVENDDGVKFHPYANITHVKGQLSSMPYFNLHPSPGILYLEKLT